MRSKLRRLGWLLLVVLFAGSALGFGLYSFLQANRDTSQSNNPQQAQTDQAACVTDGSVQSAVVLPAPEIYKASSDVTKLETTDLEVGAGAAIKAGDCLTVKYYGTLAKDGTVFEEDFTKNTVLQIQIGTGRVIPGWDQGLIGMQPGGLRRLVIPANLAYGNQAQGTIPANSALVFVVKLISVQ